MRVFWKLYIAVGYACTGCAKKEWNYSGYLNDVVPSRESAREIQRFASELEWIQNNTYRQDGVKNGGLILNLTLMKCDCEGAEWTICPKDLNGIRRIELEIHRGRQSILPENPNLLAWIEDNYKVRKGEKGSGDDGAYWHCFAQSLIAPHLK